MVVFLMNISDDLIFSLQASATRYLFYSDFNDINIFIEDTGKEYEYESIFKRMLGKKYAIETIFTTGGKKGAIEIFNEYGGASATNPKIKNLFIVDGDFDFYIHQEDMIDSPHFLYLETYNIENYFIDENACLKFAKGRLKCIDTFVTQKVAFNTWKVTIVSQATNLFILYCFIKKYHPEIQTISRPSGEFLDSNTGFERSDGAFDRYLESIKAIDSEINIKMIDIKRKYQEKNGEDYFNLICGKFLLKSLCWYLRNIIGSKFDHDDFKWHLINNFDITKLDYVKERIFSLIST